MAISLRTSSLNAHTTFSTQQQEALSEFFKKYQIVVEDWNTLPDEDPTWDRCIATLEEHYQRHMRDNCTVGVYIETIAQEWIRQMKLVKKVKQFFIDRVITNTEQLSNKARKAVVNTQMNHHVRYTCLILTNRDCIVDYQVLLTNLPHKFLPSDYGKLELNIPNLLARTAGVVSVWDVDLLLDPSFEGADATRYSEVPRTGSAAGMDRFPIVGTMGYDAHLENVVVLHRNCDALKDSLHNLSSEFQAKQRRELWEPEVERRNNRCVVISLVVLCLAISCLYRVMMPPSSTGH